MIVIGMTDLISFSFARFDGLDNLFGLFSKLDEKYDVQRAGVFAYLGPVFSYLVSCLWDKRYV